MIAILVRAWPKLSETFIAGEMLALERAGFALSIHAFEVSTDAMAGDAALGVRARVHALSDGSNGAAIAPAVARFEQSLAPGHVDAVRAFATLHHGERADALLARALVLAVQLVDERARHLHVHFASDTADVGEIAARLAGIPFSISAHAKDIWLSDAAALRRKLQAAAFTVTCTEYNRRFLSTLAAGASVQRMYHGIDTGRFRPAEVTHDEAVPLVLSVGRLREKKGFPTLIEACGKLAHAGRRFRCRIVGYGPDHAALEAQIAALGLTGVVTLAGRQPQPAVIEDYRRAAVFVLPCRVADDGDRDGIPNVLLEAMACAVPVVTTDVSGIPEAVTDGFNGRVVLPGDAAALAAAIGALLDDRNTAERFGRAGRSTVERTFDGDANLEVLRRLLADAHRAPQRSRQPIGQEALHG